MLNSQYCVLQKWNLLRQHCILKNVSQAQPLEGSLRRRGFPGLRLLPPRVLDAPVASTVHERLGTVRRAVLALLAVHLHRAEKCNSKCQSRLMYMSNSRVALLNQMQAVEVKKRKLVVFEQFTYTSTVAHRSKRNDARHYNIWTNVVLWSILQETMKSVDAAGDRSACQPLSRPLHCTADGAAHLP